MAQADEIYLGSDIEDVLEQLKDMGESMTENLEKISAYKDTLDDTWDGEANRTAFEKFDKWVTYQTAMIEDYNKLMDALESYKEKMYEIDENSL